MSMVMFPITGVVFAICAQIVMVAIGAPFQPYSSYTAIGVGFVLGVAVHGYSPLPDAAGGPITPQSGGGYWGFSPPEEDEQ
jgi:hypothetical protein